MRRMAPADYVPEIAIPPGATIRESMDAMGMTQAELAERLGRPPTKLNEIIHGKRGITEGTALALERVLPYPADFWLSLEKNCRLALAPQKETEALEEGVAWMREALPMAELVRRKLIEKGLPDRERLMAVLRFFGVGSVDVWKNRWERSIAGAIEFRRSEKQARHVGRVATWLRIGELAAQGKPYENFNRRKFLAALTDIRAATTETPEVFGPMLDELKGCGVVVSLVREIPGAGISGATRWLSKSKAHIQLSLRFKSDDQFWFTFFHEAGHILLHGKDDIFLEGSAGKPPQQKEDEANRFAAEFLIPPKEATALAAIKSKEEVVEFADRLGIAPGIVVGQMQHREYVSRRLVNFWQVKRRIDWRK